MTQLFTNNASSTLAAGISVGATSLTVFGGEGVKFPAPVAPDFALVTLYQKSGTTEINHEIVKVTARTGDILTIERAQEGTTARAFNSGDAVELRWTAGSADSKGFPTGTRMPFNQTAAPTGWTKDTTAALNDTAIRIVTGTVGGGGSVAFTTAFASQAIAGATSTGTVGATTLTESQIPSHTHNVDIHPSATSGTVYYAGSAAAGSALKSINATGGGLSHSHALTMNAHSHTAINLAVKYNDFIIASKD